MWKYGVIWQLFSGGRTFLLYHTNIKHNQTYISRTESVVRELDIVEKFCSFSEGLYAVIVAVVESLKYS